MPHSDEPLVLPAAPTVPTRPPIPVLSAVVPVVGALVLWAVTGSAFALWFAALGPLLAIASVADGTRSARRTRRRAERERRAALARLTAEIAQRHEQERAALWARHPDVVALAEAADEVWRAVPGRDEMLVVGTGAGTSALRLDGSADDAPSRAVRSAARRIERVPIAVPLTAGVAVLGPAPLAAAVARGLALQVCLSQPPGRVRVADRLAEWDDALPHGDAAGGLLLQLCEDGGALAPDADIPIVAVGDGVPPPRCAAVLRLTGPATARLDHGETTADVRVAPVSVAQAAEAARALSVRAELALGRRGDPPLALAALLPAAPPAAAGALPAVMGTAGGEPVVLDLVADGPHAVVIGVTGAGKSELLTTWVASLCAQHTPQQVTFLLVDFKGGRTFDHLEPLPHVTGVLTDLDETATLRAIESLRAEIRHRERTLGAVGARDVAEAGDALPRLVIVVDEYAALVAAHPALHELFGDLAARGRALGMHLILASQRAAGVFRDAVLANAPLRVALRVTDAGDSRAVLGGGDAAHLSGRPQARGLALVRRAADVAPATVRVARCAPATIDELAHRHPGPAARSPWLPALPARIPLADLRRGPSRTGRIVLGVADEPEEQRQRAVALDPDEPGLVVVGAPGSGRTGVLRTVAAQAAAVQLVPADPEGAWDAVAALDTLAPRTVVVADDLDALVGRLPPDYAAGLLEDLERCAREARGRGVQLVFSAQRLSGGVARLADLLPRRAILALPARADHVAAGGEAADFIAAQPAGRGRLGCLLVQFADAAPATLPAASAETPVWRPGRRPTALVAPPGPRTRDLLERWARAGVRTCAVDEPGAEPARGSVLWGGPDAWLAHWRLLGAARADLDMVIDQACGAEFRAVTGSRDLPPYAAPGRGRAWLRTPDGRVRRVRLGE